jgi:hypothetical protein
MSDEQSRTKPDPAAYVTLKEAEREVGVTRVTLKRYLSRLGIEPVSFHIKNRSLYISRDALEKVTKLKENPALLEQLRSSS